MANKALKRLNKALRERQAAAKSYRDNYRSPLQRAIDEKDFDGFHRMLEAQENAQRTTDSLFPIMAGLLLGRRR
jgi:hypothetical protein